MISEAVDATSAAFSNRFKLFKRFSLRFQEIAVINLREERKSCNISCMRKHQVPNSGATHDADQSGDSSGQAPDRSSSRADKLTCAD
ncbi:hypothetical protein CHH92_06475 [Bacillus sonorensis]|uniref:Uncharacterized protein n=1 Tax=Bacillus sonorensis L12 TaxID=1274524 RepID=M5NZL8_9BACI|nr:hypothetical protein BSONL12_16369 [Bacillus sonorensis L12]MBG9914305.1 hypothetical protein [Bacillus sonorensis]PAD61214.1 hypothetical protein CHH92_06475 [Bacillus sonorensis]RHJ12073.1 hypothetical protein DW143_07220 [Bacillus sonorensis]